ncbi:hypothetical protein LEQ_0453c [Ligilactobacillus equi DPC 6820]|uniref:Uncharacterized protein n=1 Tax=Ligilactobacillus equi DPC 6820 TaxID=1392007 RepID=V7HZF5_9LACO|nr:hypothetical protein LEQ_0453c [Ligilactobacillus equi DPC 6820]
MVKSVPMWAKQNSKAEIAAETYFEIRDPFIGIIRYLKMYSSAIGASTTT